MIVRSPDEPPVTVTVLFGPSVPQPSMSVTLRFLSKPVTPPDQAIDDRLLAGLRDGEVDLGRTHLEAELAGAEDRAVNVRGLEQLLGRDAPDVQARAPILFPSITYAMLSPAEAPYECGGVTTGAAADDHHVVVPVLGRRTHLPLGRSSE